MDKGSMIEIPPMTHELSKHWEQPPRGDVLVDEENAVMSMKTFLLLREYSATIPTGVYEGKMWRRREPYCHNPGEDRNLTGQWFLGWYGKHSTDPDKCTINFRKIILV